ncbi:hypothetical protein EC973_004053 [Apophysomyces ossiformis]|uniref:AB hydrolase-1 domain-containing protein n=1 Tax=Apophysomyces ossiformis TaxID=679940 RepID=A0A8H7BTB0_9FUNG|nr:hypothetical protein EC973_004053 [Apophysomyces ossiformis]
MQLKVIFPTLLFGISSICSASVIDYAGKKEAFSLLAKPVVGNVTTPDGSILGYRLYNGGKSDSTPVILVCGVNMLQNDWRDVIPPLAKDRPVLTYDNRGMGESSVMNDSLITMSNMVNDIQHLIQHLAWKRINLVGISMGAMISQSFAATHPTDLVLENLILVSSGHKSGLEGPIPVGQWIEEMHNPPNATERYNFQDKLFSACLTPEYIRDHPQETKAFLELIHAGKNRNFDAFMAQCVRALSHYDFTEALKTISTRTLVLHGKEDVVLLPQNGRDINALIRGSKYIEYPNGGHLLYQTNPEVIKEISEFLVSH